MEILLVILAATCFVARTPILHVPLFVIHAIFGLWVAYRLLRKQPLTSFFIIGYVLMYVPNPIAVMCGWIPSGPDEASNILYPSNALLMLGMDLFIFGARRLRTTKLDADRMPQFQISHLPVDFCIFLSIGLCTAFAIILTVGLAAKGINIFTAAKTVMTSEDYGGNRFYYVPTTYVFLSLPLAMFLIGLKRPSFQLPYVLPIIGLLIFHFMAYRVRSSFVAVSLAYVIASTVRTFLVSFGGQPKRRFGAPLRIFLVMSVPSLLLLVVVFKYARHSYMIGDYRLTEERVATSVESTFSGGDFGYAFFVRRAIALFPSPNQYLYGQSYYRLLFAPVPRSLWPGKPEDTQRIFARAHDAKLGRRGTTIPPGIVGDLYINFGWGGVLGMVGWGWLFSREKYRRFADLIFLGGSGWWIFHVVRGAVTVPLMFALTMWIFARICERIIRPVQTHRPLAMSAFLKNRFGFHSRGAQAYSAPV